MSDLIPLSKPFFEDDELEEVKKVLDSGWVSQGPKVREFEDAVAKYIGVNHAIAVANCTSALHLANLCLGIVPGDAVLVGDYTFPATGHSVLYCGAKPVFVDINPGTYNIDPEKIEDKITEKTKAIIPVHTFGQPAEMESILKIARDHNLFVIEDAACALGARYQNRYAGTVGDIGCFSFHARKGITTGEGGMVVTNDSEIADRIRYLSVFGMKTAWDRTKNGVFTIPEFHDIGYNYKMSDITAAVGVAQIRKITKIIDRKRELANIWDEHLEEIGLIEKPFIDSRTNHIFQSYVALVDRKIDRNSLIQKMLSAGVQTQIGTYASHIQPVYRSADYCPNSLDIYNRAIALPMFYSLDESTIDKIAKILKRVIGELK
jgi:dTDP-4-amino-4,6-dideoxygalactose transaminase